MPGLCRIWDVPGGNIISTGDKWSLRITHPRNTPHRTLVAIVQVQVNHHTLK